MEAERTYQRAAKERSRAFARLNRSAAAVLSLPLLSKGVGVKTDTPRATSPSFERPLRTKDLLYLVPSLIDFNRRRRDLLRSELFQRDWYLRQNPDVSASGVDPLRHFLDHGAFEGRNPGPTFDASAYLARNPDVITAAVEPWRHYFLHGKQEGRSAAPLDASPSDAARFELSPSPLNRTPSSSSFVHNIDTLDAGSLSGWAFDPGHYDNKIEVSLFIDDKMVARTVANEFRPDLAQLGLGDGNSGFAVSFPKRAYFEGQRASVFARVKGADVCIAYQSLSSARNEKGSQRPTVHLDISDLFHYMSKQRRVSGIQRVQIGFIIGLIDSRERSYNIRICARREYSGFIDVPEEPLRALLTLKEASDIVWFSRLEALLRLVVTPTDFRPGDALLTLGAPWAVANHGEVVRVLKNRGIIYLQVVYDIVPIAMPEFVDAEVIPVFSSSMASLIEYADHIFAISEFSKKEFEAVTRRINGAFPPCDVIGLGSALSAASEPSLMGNEALKQWGLDGDFVLCVGTIEPRKNHALLYSVWRRLLSNKKSSSVPKLVLVGRMGWYMEAFVRALEATDHLNGHLVVISGASDEFLDLLYRRCLFTIFPSHYEGWGLPISESLAYGKVCVCSNSSSMPEVGVDLAVYIDPDNATGAHTTIRSLIEDRTWLARSERDIQRRFAPKTWSAAAEEFSGVISSAIARACEPDSTRERAKLKSGTRYRFELPERRRTAHLQFADQIALLQLGRILSGPYWFSLEQDRCWSCGPSALLRVDCELYTQGVLLEICLPPALPDLVFSVRLDGSLLGTVRPRIEYCVLHIPLESDAGNRARFIELTIIDARTTGLDKRLLGPGVLSIFPYASDIDTALREFLRTEIRGRNKDMDDLMQNFATIGQSDQQVELHA